MSVSAMIAGNGKRVKIVRPSIVRGTSLGEEQHTLVTVVSNVLCWICPAEAELIALFDRQGKKLTHTGYLVDSRILERDHIEMGNRKFLVHGVRNIGEMGRLWVLDLEEVH